MPDKIKNIFQESDLLDLFAQGFRSIKENKLDEALSHFEAVVAAVRNAKDPKLLCVALGEQALAYQKQGQRQKALGINEEALTIAKEKGLSYSKFTDPPTTKYSLHIEQAGRQLIIHLIPDPSRECYLLLLEEQKPQSFSIAALELLGLTKREAEVLFWIAKDKSNAQIAKVLGCREGTVRKHLEHLYKKLDVQTRTAAVMLALEKLGLLKG